MNVFPPGPVPLNLRVMFHRALDGVASKIDKSNAEQAAVDLAYVNKYRTSWVPPRDTGFLADKDGRSYGDWTMRRVRDLLLAEPTMNANALNTVALTVEAELRTKGIDVTSVTYDPQFRISVKDGYDYARWNMLASRQAGSKKTRF